MSVLRWTISTEALLVYQTFQAKDEIFHTFKLLLHFSYTALRI